MKHTLSFCALLLLAACNGHIDGGMRADSYADPHGHKQAFGQLHRAECAMFNDPVVNDDTPNSVSAQIDAHNNVDAMTCERH